MAFRKPLCYGLDKGGTHGYLRVLLLGYFNIGIIIIV